MKKVVAGTGLSGLIGSRFAELYDDKYEWENWDLTTGIDITDKSMVDERVANTKAEVILHMAAFTNVSAAHEQSGDKNGLCYRINVEGTEHLARAAERYKKYFIHLSTDYVFDGKKKTAYTETDKPNPIEWYGQTKLMAEEIIIKRLPQASIIRLAFPYQARPVRPDFLANIRLKLEANTMPPSFDDHMITPTLADDLTRVFDKFIEERPSGIYHAVGSSSHTDYEIAEMVKEAFGLETEVRRGSLAQYLKTTTRPYQMNMMVSNEKLKKELGIEMRTFKEGLAEVKRQLKNWI